MVQAASSKYRDNLPNLGDTKFMTCAGFETTMVFDKQIDLPCFAAYTVMSREDGKDIGNWFYKQYLDIAVEKKLPIILDSFTWRSTQGWADKRVRLVFEAVDYEAEVKVNGEVAGSHRGGYDRCFLYTQHECAYG